MFSFLCSFSLSSDNGRVSCCGEVEGTGDLSHAMPSGFCFCGGGETGNTDDEDDVDDDDDGRGRLA